MHLKPVLLAAVVLLAWTDSAPASLIFNFSEIDGNVEVNMTGSIDLNATLGLYNPYEGAWISSNTYRTMNPSEGVVLIGDAVNSQVYWLSSTWIRFGFVDEYFDFDQSTGDRVALWSGGQLGLPIGYVSGAPLSARGVFFGETFASLNLAPRFSTTTFRNGGFTDTVSVNIGHVPEPSTLLYVGLGLIHLACTRSRRRRVTARR